MKPTMDPFAYNYLVGGMVFVVGLIIAWRMGAVGFSGAGARWLLLSIGVFAFFFCTQGFLQFIAPEMPVAKAGEYAGTDQAEAGPTAEGESRGRPIDYAIMLGYFLLILIIGTWFGRRQQSTRDFFFGGRRFAWWLIAFSMIATTIGSYSFIKYSSKGFQYGLSSSQTYLNDWMWFPLLLFGWLPILYYTRLTSIPEYFGRRFNSTVRFWATICLLLYMVGYVGVNLYTMGKVLHHLLGWDIFWAAVLVAVVSMTYVTTGGQTSVIMTDLFQGVMLLFTGLLIIVLGAAHLGGLDLLWQNLPADSRRVFHNYNADPGFPSVGIFWQDGMANSAMFAFLHQGTIMRYMAARSLADSRKAVVVHLVVLMTLAACVVGGGGWVARALVHHGDLPKGIESGDAFYAATEFLSAPGMFGLILAAMTAALMSTVDTLITAVSAVFVNDIYRPYIQPGAGDRKCLRMARITAVGSTVIGLVLVPVFMQFGSIYDAHGAFTAAVTPPLVVTFLLSVFWRRFTAPAALATLVVGLSAILFSIFVPEVIRPFAHGVPAIDAGEGLLAGAKQYKFMRAFFGRVVCAVTGFGVAFLTRPEPVEKQHGLVWGRALRPLDDEGVVRTAMASVRQVPDDIVAEQETDVGCGISRVLADKLDAAVGDSVYVCDSRW